MALIAFQARADFTADAPQTIQLIATGWGGEGLYVVAQAKPSLCSGTTYFMPPNAPMYKDNYAALLAAYQSNGKIQLFYNGCEANGNASLKAVTLTK